MLDSVSWLTVHYTDTVPRLEINADHYPMTITCQLRDESGDVVADQVMTRTVPTGTELGLATEPVSVTWALELPPGQYEEWCQVEVLTGVYSFDTTMDSQNFFKVRDIEVTENGEWFEYCPVPPPTATDSPQPTYTSRPPYTPRPTPTCRPTWTSAPGVTPYPTATPYPTSTSYPTQPPF